MPGCDIRHLAPQFGNQNVARCKGRVWCVVHPLLCWISLQWGPPVMYDAPDRPTSTHSFTSPSFIRFAQPQILAGALSWARFLQDELPAVRSSRKDIMPATKKTAGTEEFCSLFPSWSTDNPTGVEWWQSKHSNPWCTQPELWLFIDSFIKWQWKRGRSGDPGVPFSSSPWPTSVSPFCVPLAQLPDPEFWNFPLQTTYSVGLTWVENTVQRKQSSNISEHSRSFSVHFFFLMVKSIYVGLANWTQLRWFQFHWQHAKHCNQEPAEDWTSAVHEACTRYRPCPHQCH